MKHNKISGKRKQKGTDAHGESSDECGKSKLKFELDINEFSGASIEIGPDGIPKVTILDKSER